MNPEPQVEGCRDVVPGVCMSQDANYSQPRWWNLVRGRPLTDRRISDYMRRGYYREARLRKVGGNTGNRLVYGAESPEDSIWRFLAHRYDASSTAGTAGNGNLARKLRAHLTCGAF